MLPYTQDDTRTGYEMIHANTVVSKFLVLEFTRVADPDAKGKPPLLNKDDYVILFQRDVSLNLY